MLSAEGLEVFDALSLADAGVAPGRTRLNSQPSRVECRGHGDSAGKTVGDGLFGLGAVRPEKAAARGFDLEEAGALSDQTCPMGADSLGVESKPDRLAPKCLSYFALKSPPPSGCTPSIL
jgi:hypothetical protein